MLMKRIAKTNKAIEDLEQEKEQSFVTPRRNRIGVRDTTSNEMSINDSMHRSNHRSDPFEEEGDYLGTPHGGVEIDITLDDKDIGDYEELN